MEATLGDRPCLRLKPGKKEKNKTRQRKKKKKRKKRKERKIIN